MDYNQLGNLRDMINGELNRIAVSDDIKEIDNMYKYLVKNIKDYYEESKNNRINKNKER